MNCSIHTCNHDNRVAYFRYVFQLAIADSIFLISLSFQVTEDFNQGWIYEEWMCKAKQTVLFLNYYASMFFLVVIIYISQVIFLFFVMNDNQLYLYLSLKSNGLGCSWYIKCACKKQAINLLYISNIAQRKSLKSA